MISKLFTFTLLNLVWLLRCSLFEIKSFQNDNFKYFNQFHVLPDKKIIFGTRDYILKFNLDDISRPTDIIDLQPDPDLLNQCKFRGQSDDLCRNFILVLFTFKEKFNFQIKNSNSKDHIFKNETEDLLISCGTNAFRPTCTFHQLNNLSKINKKIDGSLLCPYSPHHHFTLLHSEGDLYFGGPTDLLAKNKIFLRNTLQNPEKNFVQTFIDDSKIFYSDAYFIYSFETKDYVYFLFKETSVEDLMCSKKITSRIGRVCKNDLGTKTSIGRFWNTFIKAKINCSFKKELTNQTILFDEIVDANYLKEESKLFVVFRKQEEANLNNQAIVCTYDLKDIEIKFNDSFSYQQNLDSIWSRYEDRVAIKQFQCLLTEKEINLQQNQRKYQIIYNTIDTKLNHLLINNSFFNFKKIQVDSINELKNLSSIYIVYLITNDNHLAIFLMNLKDKINCFMNKIKVISNDKEQILKFKFSKNLKTIFIGSTNQFLKVQISNCQTYKSRSNCLKSDLYCVWDNLSKKCEFIDTINNFNLSYHEHLEQPNFTSFCQITIPKNQFSYKFEKDVKCIIEDDQTKHCLCNYDLTSENPFRINSCTIDGGWSKWSNWSNCKDGKKERTRQCTNPLPLNGGKKCEGDSIEIESCISLFQITEWSNCSTRCGTGYQTRSKIYFNNLDFLNTTEMKECKGNQCSNQDCRCVECDELISNNNFLDGNCKFSKSIWSPCGSSCSIAYQFKQISKNMFLKRKCDTNKKCKGWSEWSEWTKCVNGKKSKQRYCFDEECLGEYKTTIVCDSKNDNSSLDSILINDEKTISDNGLSLLMYNVTLRTLIIACCIFFLAGLLSGYTTLHIHKNRNYFQRKNNKNLSLRSVSSPLIRSENNTYITQRNGSKRSDHSISNKSCKTVSSSFSTNFSNSFISLKPNKFTKENQF